MFCLRCNGGTRKISVLFSMVTSLSVTGGTGELVMVWLCVNWARFSVGMFER